MNALALRLLAAAMLLFAFSASAATRYVAITSTNPVSPFITWETAATNIQDAIDVSVSNDTVLVSNGVYATGGRVVHAGITNRIAITNAIRVESLNGPDLTYIMGDGTSYSNTLRCAYVGSNGMLVGFTLTNGAVRQTTTESPTMESGGGVYCETSSIVSNCVISGNAAGSRGGGGYSGNYYNCVLSGNSSQLDGGGVLTGGNLANCIIKNNRAYRYGGGAYGGTYSNCMFKANTASYDGGGAIFGAGFTTCLFDGNQALSGSGGGVHSAGKLYGCQIISNSASGNGGGAYNSILYDCLLVKNVALLGGGAASASLVNCTVSRNSAASGGGVASCSVLNSVCYFNTTSNYINSTFTNSCATPLPPGAGNIALNPSFISLTDYHLSHTSKCINAASNYWSRTSTDLDGNPRTNSLVVDMGCYELPTSACTGLLSVIIQTPFGTNACVGSGQPLFFAQVTGRFLSLRWSFGDGSSTTDQLYASHSYSTTGSYSVIVTVTNYDYAASATTRVQLAEAWLLRWQAATNTSWDYLTPSWRNLSLLQDSNTFIDGANVVIDDLSTSIVRTVVIPSGSTVNPGSVALNATGTNLYLKGTLGGTGGVEKTSQGTATMEGSSTFLGPVTVSEGTLRAGNLFYSFGLPTGNAPSTAIGDVASPLRITGGTFDLNCQGSAGSGWFLYLVKSNIVIAGDGASGRGAIVNDGTHGPPSGSDSPFIYKSAISLSSNASIGGLRRWNIRQSTFNMGGNILTKTGTSVVYISQGSVVDGAIVVNQGYFGLQFGASMTSGSINVSSNGALWFWHSFGLVSAPISLDGATIAGEPASGLQKSLVHSRITLSNQCRVGCYEAGQQLCLMGSIEGAGGLVKYGLGSVTIGGDCSYDGATSIDSGPMFINGSLGTGAVFIANLSTLRGTGSIGGPVSSQGNIALGTISSMTVVSNIINNGTNVYGTMNMLNSYTQASNGILTVRIVSPALNDSLYVAQTAFLNGTLAVSLINSNAMTNGSTVTILSAANIVGRFSNTNLPLLLPGYGWTVEYGQSNVMLSVTGSALSGYALWAYPITNGLTGYSDSATGDGYPNLLKYATGSSPKNKDKLAAMNGELSSNGLFAIRFNRNTNATDVSLIVEGSDTATNGAAWFGIVTNILGSWGGATNVVESGTNSPVSVSVQDTAPFVSNRFLRLRVTRP